MNNKVTRVALMLVIACVLYAAGYYFATPANAKWMDFVRGASAGFALAGCIGFILLILDRIKNN
jgi:hypothetical protein